MDNRRLVILVEGESELMFINQQVIPSKRLLCIFNYNKVADSSEMLTIIGFDTIYSKCPRFSSWFDRLVSVIQ